MKKILIPMVIIAVILTFIYTLQGTDDQRKLNPEKYIAEIKQERRDKENYMKFDQESPFKKQNKVATFKGLNYFEPDLKYRVEANIEKIANPQTITLPTSDNKHKQYLTWGYATFKIEEQPQKLLLLKPKGPFGDNLLFLGFTDLTSAGDTYGGGRYLDIEVPDKETITLDFNRAYNPYCAYTEGYSCPLPPKENNMSIAIRAGEKTYEKYD